MAPWLRGRTEAASTEPFPGFSDLEVVGRGGFSVVYRARHERLGRSVAVKVLTAESIGAPARRRFQRELQLASRLAGHPHVVTVLDSGRSGWGRPYLVMDYFERGSLGDQLGRSGPLPVADVLRFGVKIAGALDAAHQAGMLHQDVKPQNILVSRYDEPALADFGTARLTGSFEVSMRSDALTPFHAAPELLQGGSPSVASDVYSLGSTLYQLLSGGPPHQTGGRGIAGLLLAVLTGDPPAIAREDVPAGLTAALRRAMAPQPADRFTDAAAFAAALQEVQSGLGLPVTEFPRMGPELPPASMAVAPTVHSVPSPSPSPSLVGAVAASPMGQDTVRVSPAGSRRRGGRGWLLGAGIALVVVLATTAPLLLARTTRPGLAAAPTAHASAAPVTVVPTPPASTPPPPPAPAAPSLVADNGVTVTLRWTLSPAAGVYPVLVQLTPVAQPARLAPPQPAGTTSFTVTDLDARTGYCFQVGLLLAVGQGGTAATVVWSAPTCIRGAQAA